MTLQDGTNTILKEPKKPVDDLMSDFKILVEETKNSFNPEKVFVCELPPLREPSSKSDANIRISQFNERLNDWYLNDETVEVIRINQHISEYPAPHQLFFDEIHFNHQVGLPLLRNIILNIASPIFKQHAKKSLPK